jgi:hypothetical protein
VITNNLFKTLAFIAKKPKLCREASGKDRPMTECCHLYARTTRMRKKRLIARTALKIFQFHLKSSTLFQKMKILSAMTAKARTRSRKSNVKHANLNFHGHCCLKRTKILMKTIGPVTSAQTRRSTIPNLKSYKRNLETTNTSPSMTNLTILT